jgi:hypothetical protein
MRKERKPKTGRHHAHAQKLGNGRKRGQRRTSKKPTSFVFVLADADFEAWFRAAKRDLGMA